ncbi:hypothetical protein JCM11641_003820 [Rhodosporidiobolus odoratus]
MELPHGLEAFLAQSEAELLTNVKLYAAPPSQPIGAGASTVGVKTGGGSVVQKEEEVDELESDDPDANPLDPNRPNNPEDDRILLSLHQRAIPMKDVATRLNRSIGYVCARTQLLKERQVALLNAAPFPPHQSGSPAAPPAPSTSSIPPAQPKRRTASPPLSEWLQFDDAALRVFKKQGLNWKGIAKKMGKSKADIRARWKANKSAWKAQGLLSEEPPRPSSSSAPLAPTRSRLSSSVSPPPPPLMRKSHRAPSPFPQPTQAPPEEPPRPSPSSSVYLSSVSPPPPPHDPPFLTRKVEGERAMSEKARAKRRASASPKPQPLPKRVHQPSSVSPPPLSAHPSPVRPASSNQPRIPELVQNPDPPPLLPILPPSKEELAAYQVTETDRRIMTAFTEARKLARVALRALEAD